MNRRMFVIGLVALSGALPACSKKSSEAAVPLTVRDDSQGLLFVWIDAKGDAHTETKADGVPADQRAVVRILQPGLDDGTHDVVFLADLRTKGADGTYPLRRAPKSEFEAIATTRRTAAGPTLGTAEREAGVAKPEDNQRPTPIAPPKVVIYGASWCKPCHEAADYFQRIGVPFVLKDIEKEPAAASEMREKLANAGLRGGSIPVLDVGGKILIGYNQTTVDKALVAGGY